MRRRVIQKLRGLGRVLLPPIAAAMPLLAAAEPALVDAAGAQQIALAAAGCDLIMIAHWDDSIRRTRLELAKALGIPAIVTEQ